MAVHSFLGTWEVVGYGYQGMSVNGTLEGVRFQLDEHGDVTWTVSENLKAVPLFSCETYEIYSTSVLGVVVRFGACAGHVIEFKADQVEPRDKVVLTCEGWCMLYCRRVKEDPVDHDASLPFTLLPALEDGYFSDIKIAARNNKEFKVHSCIIQLHGRDIEWQSKPAPFTGLPEPVLGTILHFLYAECLPHTLDEETAREVIAAVSSYQCLSKLVNMCNIYLKNMELKMQTIGLVNDMHNCLNTVVEYFNASSRYSSSPDSIVNNPAKLCFVVKQSVRETSVAGVKLLLLCDLFSRRKNELTRQERHEIILYAKSRLPIFLQQITRFLHALKNTFATMTLDQRQEVATYLVPEIEVILDTLSMLIVEVEKALQKIIQVLSPLEAVKGKCGFTDMFGKLRSVLHSRELTKLRNFHEHITCSLGLLLRRKENFNKMSLAQKIRCVTTDVEKLIEELPMFLMRLEEVTAALDEKLEWREFKFCFKVGTSKLSGVLSKLVSHRDTLQNVMIQVCDLVQRNTFTESLQKLNLLDPANMPTYTEDCQKINITPSSAPNHQQGGYKLNLVEGLCRSPISAKSKLSRYSLQLLKSDLGTDMEFEVVVNNSTAEQTMREHSEADEQPPAQEEERCVIRAHRAIVAARCDWFRRALLSGMREAIDKKIVIHDTNPFLFRIFLEYLYSGRLKQKSLTTEQLAELLLLSDRYEVDHLKQTCEFALESSIDQDSVLYFLSMADQFNARHLRNACLKFISHHQELTESEVFDELPIALQAEIFDCVWLKAPPRKSTTTEHLLPGTPTSPDSSISDVQRAFTGMHLSSPQACHSNSSSLEDLPSCQDSARLNTCIAELRDIVGEAPSREKLIQIILAADYDLCRALNYFYAENNQDK